jgi:hypothetical protein
MSLRGITGSYEGFEFKDRPSHLYNICLASDSHLPDLQNTIFEGRELYDSQTEDYFKGVIEAIYNSASYKIGNTLVKSLKGILSLFKIRQVR